MTAEEASLVGQTPSLMWPHPLWAGSRADDRTAVRANER